MTTPPSGSLRERSKAKRRRAIQHAALRLFAERGYDGATIADIADAAEVAPRTVSMYFPTKFDIAMSLSSDLADRLTAAFDEHPELSFTGVVDRWIVAEVESADPEFVSMMTAMYAANPALRAASTNNVDRAAAVGRRGADRRDRFGARGSDGPGRRSGGGCGTDPVPHDGAPGPIDARDARDVHEIPTGDRERRDECRMSQTQAEESGPAEHDGRRTERAHALKERIYASFTGLAILAAITANGHSTAKDALLAVAVGVLGISAAGFLAEVVAHQVAHERMPSGGEVATMGRTALGAWASAFLPVVVLALSWAGAISLDWALWIAMAIYAATLVAVMFIAARQSGLRPFQRLVSAAMLLGMALVVVAVLQVAHLH